MPPTPRLLLVLVLAGTAASAAEERAAEASREAWAAHCGQCHFDGAADGNLALDALR